MKRHESVSTYNERVQRGPRGNVRFQTVASSYPCRDKISSNQQIHQSLKQARRQNFTVLTSYGRAH